MTNKIPTKKALAMSLVFIISACASSKVNMIPDSKIPYRSGDKLLITRLEAVKTSIANELYQEATTLFKPHPGIELLDESDVLFKIKQYGLDLPKYDNYTRAGLEQIREKTGLDYILVSKLLGQRSYQKENRNEAILAFKLYDLKAKTATVDLNIKTTISPFTWDDKHGDTYTFNPTTTTSAILKAYKKSIKKFYKAFQSG